MASEFEGMAELLQQAVALVERKLEFSVPEMHTDHDRRELYEAIRKLNPYLETLIELTPEADGDEDNLPSWDYIRVRGGAARHLALQVVVQALILAADVNYYYGRKDLWHPHYTGEDPRRGQ
jgi:hypothetical protein